MADEVLSLLTFEDLFLVVAEVPPAEILEALSASDVDLWVIFLGPPTHLTGDLRLPLPIAIGLGFGLTANTGIAGMGSAVDLFSEEAILIDRLLDIRFILKEEALDVEVLVAAWLEAAMVGSTFVAEGALEILGSFELLGHSQDGFSLFENVGAEEGTVGMDVPVLSSCVVRTDLLTHLLGDLFVGELDSAESADGLGLIVLDRH